MRTGASSDEVKSRLKTLQAKIDQHQRAVDDATRDHGTNTMVRDYGVEWTLFKKKVADLATDADAWTSIVLLSTVENAEREFGIKLTDFEALSQKLNMANNANKIKALETILASTQKAKDEYKQDGAVKLQTDARPIPVPVIPPPSPPSKPEGLPGWVVPVTGLGGLLFLLKKIFFG